MLVRLGGELSIRSALLDIGRALEAGHPSPLKLLERKCACLEGLGHFSEVIFKIYIIFFLIKLLMVLHSEPL